MHERQILELTTVLCEPLGLGEALGAALAILTRELQATRAAFFVRDGDGELGAPGRAWLHAGGASDPALPRVPGRHRGARAGRRGPRPSRPRAARADSPPQSPDRRAGAGAPRGTAVRSGGPRLPAPRGRLRGHTHRERPPARRAAEGPSEALAEGIRAAQPLRRLPRPGGGNRGRRHSKARHDERDGPLPRVPLRHLSRWASRPGPRPRSRAGTRDPRSARPPSFPPKRRGARSRRSPGPCRWSRCPTDLSVGGCSRRGWPSSRRCPPGRAWKACWRSASGPPGCPSPRRTARWPRPSPVRPWRRSRPLVCSGCARRSCARTASFRSHARSSRASSRRSSRTCRGSTWPPGVAPATRWAATPTTGSPWRAGESPSWSPTSRGRERPPAS